MKPMLHSDVGFYICIYTKLETHKTLATSESMTNIRHNVADGGV